MTAMRCPICDSCSYREVQTLKGFTILECDQCYLVYCAPMQGADSEFYAQHIAYRADEETVQAELSRTYRLPFYRSIIGRLNPGSRILDIGCGYGAFVRYAVQCGMDAYGIDFDKGRLQLGRRLMNLGDRLLAGDVSTIKKLFPVGSFNLVTMFEVIEHVEDPKGLVENVRELVCDDGYVAVCCPNEARWKPFGRIFVDYPPHHLTRWYPATLRCFFEHLGFQHVETLLDSSIRDLLQTLLINRAAKKRVAGEHPGEVKSSHLRRCFRRVKFFMWRVIGHICKPVDLCLMVFGVGTDRVWLLARRRRG